MEMVIYHYVERIIELLLHSIFPYNIYKHKNIIQVNQLIYLYNNL